MVSHFKLSFLVLVLASVGCGGGPTSVVEGTVTLDGQPLEYGSISLKPESGETNAVGGVIEDGKFTIEKVPEGSFIAIVTAGVKNAGGGPNPSQGDGQQANENSEEMQRYVAVKNAEGNNKKISVTDGQNEVSIDLTTSGS